ALRLVQQRHETNRRRVRLRHLLLLALRIAAIALLALALARPSVKFSGSLGSQEAPVAAAMAFDAAPRMEYRQANETRLEAARNISEWLLPQLPPESQVAVLDTRLGPAAFQVDRAAAASRIARLEPVANSRSLPDAIDEALRLLAESDLARKEVYVFTDMARAAWPADAAARLQQRAAQLPEAMVYLIDVGVKSPTNFGLGEPRLSAQRLSSLGTLRIETELIRLGGEGQRTVELFVDNEAGEPQKRGQQIVEVAEGGAAAVEFHVGNLAEGAHQGHVRIGGQDALPADDIRYFSVEVRAPWRVLVIDPRSNHTYVDFLPQMLAPESLRRRGMSRFECATIAQTDLAKTELDGYSAVCLADPSPLSAAEWDKLHQYVAGGGALAVFLGRNARPIASFNSVEAARLLAGPLVRQVPSREGDLHLAPGDLRHPILAEFQAVRGAIPWSDMPIFRYWEFGKMAEGTGVVVPYSDGRPALLERTVGKGRVLVMTTPATDLPRGNPWNLLPVADPWPFLILTNQAMLYLVGSADQRLNYFAGQTAAIGLDPASRFRSYLVTTPGGVAFPLSVDPKENRIVITSTDEPGNYRVQAGGRTTGVDHGFSVNLEPRQTELERITREELDELLGPIQHQVARNRDEIERSVSMARVGRELFPLLIILLALVLAAEHVLANRFYRE
ncbi:MAG: hypothetical protein GX621_10505, partial [Pirellulaceae bacterium]|nr:hypothetical protein [Pirellulaceae bacterium]